MGGMITLNPAGKEVMLKSVALTLPNYVMSCVKLPEKLCKELNGMMARFWWGDKDNEMKIYWLAWDTLCEKKGGGGLGFRGLACFNLSLLAKQGWRLIRDGKCLLHRILKAKYFPMGSFLAAKTGHNPSWTWRSILEGQKVLEARLRWRIGSGSKVIIDEHPWLQGGYKRKEGQPLD